MVDLVYHTPATRDGDRSPFDALVEGITTGASVTLVSPYVSPSVLRDIDSYADDWRLLTDVPACLDAQRGQREAVVDFLREHPSAVHTLDGLHAKAVIGPESALVGSANLTETGLRRRDELGVHLTESEAVAELHEWAADLWKAAETPSEAMLTVDADRTHGTVPERTNSATSAGTRRVRAGRNRPDSRSGPSGPDVPTGSDEHRGRLVKRIGRAPGRAWVDSRFDLMESVLDTLGIAEQNPQLVTSVPASGGVHLTVHRRYVLTFLRHSHSSTSFILPGAFVNGDEILQEAAYREAFEGDENAPLLLGFEEDPPIVHRGAFRRAWRRAALDELKEGGTSPYRSRSHTPLVYRAAVDHEFRRRLLDEAFDD